MISSHLITKLQRILSEESGKDVPYEEAADLAYGLIGLFEALGGINDASQG